MTIRNMKKSDAEKILEMMRVFYSSDAVFSNGSDEIFKKDIENCVNDSPYLVGYVFEDKGEILGYAMTAKSFSTEFGKPCVWLEDLYICPEHQGKGIGTEFLGFLEREFQGCIIRLEVEAENTKAVHTYEKCGFDVLPYMEMTTVAAG